jgi:hypothetical protein
MAADCCGLRVPGAIRGLLQTRPADQADAEAAALITFSVELALACDEDGLFAAADPVLLSAGGTRSVIETTRTYF